MKEYNYGYEVCRQCRTIFKKKTYSNSFCSDACKEQFNLIKKENLKHIETARYRIFERDDFKCVYCGKSSIEDRSTLCIDHVEPYNVRMNNNVYNLVTSCLDCNIGKGPYRLRREVYYRVIEANKKRTEDKMSEDSRLFVSRVLDLYFNEQKKDKQ